MSEVRCFMNLEKRLAKLERKLAAIQRLIEDGHLGGLTYFRLNSVCRKIEKLDALKQGRSP